MRGSRTMRSSWRLITVPIITMLIVSCSRNPENSVHQSKATLEFRRAELEPKHGLTEVFVPGWDVPIYLYETADLTAADVSEARVIAASRESDPVVELVFTAEGSRKIATLTEEHHGKRFAILLNGRVVSAPTILAQITGRVQITGAFSEADADRLVKSINGK